MSPEGQCYVCPAHCLYTEHYHARKTMKVKQQKLQDVLHDIKAKYDSATKNKADFQSRIMTTQDAKKMLERALKQKLEEIKHKCAELRRICSGFNLAQELHALIDQLRAEATMLRNIEAKQQAEEFIRSLSEFCRQLEADQNARHVLPPMRLVDTYTSKPFRSMSTTPSSTSATPVPSSPISPSENTPNLNTSVLDLITKLNKPKKPLAPVSDDEDGSENGDDDDDDDGPRDTAPASARSGRHSSHQGANENNHDEEISSINDRRKRRQSGVNPATLQQQFTSSTTADLVQRYSDCKDTRKSNAILTELNRRSQGKSTGPLLSPIDIGTFARYTQLYGSQDAPTLSHLYLQLQQRISNMTEPDILNIARVPSDLLLEISALYTLIAQKNQQAQNRDAGMANESSFERPPDHIAASMMGKMSTPTSQAPAGFYSQPVNHHPGGAMTPAVGPTVTSPSLVTTHFKPIDTTHGNHVNIHPQTSQQSFVSSPPLPPPPPPPPSSSGQQQHQTQPQPNPLTFASFAGRNDNYEEVSPHLSFIRVSHNKRKCPRYIFTSSIPATVHEFLIVAFHGVLSTPTSFSIGSIHESITIYIHLSTDVQRQRFGLCIRQPDLHVISQG